MKPTLAAEELRRNLTHYLTTTFALADEPAREGLERFLNHPTQGIFRGPYLRIRTPFKEAPDGWRRKLTGRHRTSRPTATRRRPSCSRSPPPSTSATPEVGYLRVLTQRGEIRRARPDFLITNYKMLDLLLQRADDLPLWEGTDLRYVVVDEFHTYDGAQGAVLLRRLAAATGSSEPGRPLGRICPVATSATLGEGGDGTQIREVARAVFGTESAMKAEAVSSCDLRMSRSPSQVSPPGLFARVR